MWDINTSDQVIACDCGFDDASFPHDCKKTAMQARLEQRGFKMTVFTKEDYPYLTQEELEKHNARFESFVALQLAQYRQSYEKTWIKDYCNFCMKTTEE